MVQRLRFLACLARSDRKGATWPLHRGRTHCRRAGQGKSGNMLARKWLDMLSNPWNNRWPRDFFFWSCSPLAFVMDHFVTKLFLRTLRAQIDQTTLHPRLDDLQAFTRSSAHGANLPTCCST